VTHFRSEEFRWDVQLADETVLEALPDVPHMSENFCYTGYDPTNRLGYYVHIGRWIKDPQILREFLMLWLPNGDVLWAQGFGRGDCTRGPAVACERLLCEEPGRRIRVLYSGPMQLIPLAEIAAPSTAPTSLDKVEVDLLFEGTSATWYYPEADNTTWSRWHTEQLGKVGGTIRHVDAIHRFSGVGYRDHSRGPRYLEHFRGHSWIQGQFPEGDSFALYQMWQIIDGREVEALSEVKLHTNGEFVTARIISAPRLISSANVLGDYELVIEAPSGTMEITGIPRGLAFFSYGTLMSHFIPGIPTGNAEFFMTNVEQPSVFRCNGRTAIGHTERSYYRGHAERVFERGLLEQAYARAPGA
jgi:hypothetical protein